MKAAKIIAGVAIIVGLLIAAKTLPIGDYIRQFLNWVEGLGYWGPLTLGIAYVIATVLFIPGFLLTLGAGALFGVVVGTIVVSLGSIIGSTFAFLIGRYLARDWVASKVQAFPRFKAVDEAVGRSGFKIVLLTRLSPLFPYNMLGYMYGITKVRLRDYFFASWIGMFPGTVMYVYIGSVLGLVAAEGERQRTTGEYVLYGVGLLATIAVTVVITKIARRAMQESVPGAAAATDDADQNNLATDSPGA